VPEAPEAPEALEALEWLDRSVPLHSGQPETAIIQSHRQCCQKYDVISISGSLFPDTH